MKILVTNDDGINSEGLIRLAECARDFGEVWVIAPESERSAASHCITLRTHIDIYPHDFPVDGVRAFTCSGMPGDCVRVGGLSVMDSRPDLVLSGINFGYNVASDIQYSATCGAAFEAEFQGYRAIAVSEGGSGIHEVTDKYLKEIITEVLGYETRPRQIINVNFPGCPLSEYRGILRDRTVSCGMVFRDIYNAIEDLENSGVRYMVEGIRDCKGEPGTDLEAVISGYISIGYAKNIQ
ncbi:MAG: 5'/3'-nucleotidase SurE [Lachnospiraceae bacterium]|nr:5'/3'-nucleotidase SurE [Lachnospiraceae bacterium]